MSEELQQKLRTQLWTVANTLRGNMSAGDFMYFTLGFIFYKYKPLLCPCQIFLLFTKIQNVFLYFFTKTQNVFS